MNDTIFDPFNPDSSYKVPKAEGKYLQFAEGETEFMPLASPILGYAYWNTQNKPVRSAEPFEELPEDIRIDPKTNEPEKIKHFWAFPVYDLTPGATIKVKVLEITQKTVMKQIVALTKNAKWGRPVLKYSITVTRDDSQSPVAYSIMPNPVTEVTQEIIRAWESTLNKGFNIKRLYTGEDPFEGGADVDSHYVKDADVQVDPTDAHVPDVAADPMAEIRAIQQQVPKTPTV